MGVAFIPIHVYHNPGHPDHGKVCIVLGRERAGSYAGKYNFIGGSSNGHSGIWNTICEEVEEELGLILDLELYRKCLVAQIKTAKTTFAICKISGLSSRKWHAMMQKRQSVFNLEWKFQEMDDVKHFPLEHLYNRTGSVDQVSSYVLEYINTIVETSAKSTKGHSVHYSQFMSIAKKKRIPMLE